MHITSFNVSTKKGESQPTRWIISQEVPHPCQGGHFGGIQWTNGDGLFPVYGQPANGLPFNYYCYLLAPDIEVPPDYNRTHFAGYTHGHRGKETTNAGTILYRGKDLGELEIKMNSYRASDGINWNHGIKVRGHGAASPSERDMLRALVIPKLLEYIESNKVSLYWEAVRKIEGRFRQVIEESRNQINTMRAQADEALAMLNEKAPKP